jgi:hypothetical protein
MPHEWQIYASSDCCFYHLCILFYTHVFCLISYTPDGKLQFPDKPHIFDAQTWKTSTSHKGVAPFPSSQPGASGLLPGREAEVT